MNTKPPDHQSILDEMEQAEKQLASLRSEQKEVESTIQSLKAHLARYTSENNSGPTRPVVSYSTLTPEEKIILFRRLFRGGCLDKAKALLEEHNSRHKLLKLWSIMTTE